FSGLVYVFYSYQMNQNMVYYGIGAGLIFLLGYLIVKKELKDKVIHFLGIFIFVVTCLYIFSIDFAFNKVLQEHQRTRITVLLGEEDKLIEQIEQLKLAKDKEGLS